MDDKESSNQSNDSNNNNNSSSSNTSSSSSASFHCDRSLSTSTSQQVELSSEMNELRSTCIRAFRAAIAAVQPFERVRNALQLSNGHQLRIGKRVYELNHNIHMAAIGKAALGMVEGAEASIGTHLVQGIASVPRHTLQKIPAGSELRTKFYEGATNNLPDNDACLTAIKIEHMAKCLNNPNDIFLVLLSGGGSALLPAPIPSISLADKLATIKAMTSRGAEIKQLNSVRKALSRLKGGKLAEAAHPAKVLSVIISDIVGDPIDLIASGPTVIGQQQSLIDENPVKILKGLNAWADIPLNVQQALLKSLTTVPKKPNVDVLNTIISNNETAIRQVSSTLKERGYSCHIASTTIAQDATLFGHQLASLIKHILIDHRKPELALRELNMSNINVACPDDDHIALLFGGETTVTLTGKGKGGRNQQIVLSALSDLLQPDTASQLRGEFALMSAGTDGQDGPTEAAGAVLTSDDLRFIHKNGRWEKSDIDSFLRKNDSYNFWKLFRDGLCHINTGPTGTNVMDVQVLLLRKKFDIFTL